MLKQGVFLLLKECDPNDFPGRKGPTPHSSTPSNEASEWGPVNAPSLGERFRGHSQRTSEHKGGRGVW